MAKLPLLKRLTKEDFSSDEQALIDKIGFVFNPAIESLSSAFSNNITFSDNIDSQIKDLNVTVDGSGIPITTVSFGSSLKNKSKGVICLRATNNTNPGTYPSGAPFISYSENSKTITINNITGLQASQEYRLSLLII